MADAVTTNTLSDEEHQRQLVKAVVASTVGTAIEWYDFFLYGVVAGLVFGPIFFPASSPLTGTLLAFSTFLVGFLARPLGAAIFGHYGDRIGRKATLVATLMVMGVATFAIAFVPTYESIGIWGGVMLTVLRFVQGIGVGGEWGGSVLLAMEWTRSHKNRGFITSWPQFGVPLGLFLANLAVLAVSTLTGDDFFTYGWRIPFLFSALLVIIGLYIRIGIEETPTFKKLKAENKIERSPMLEVIKRQPKEILLSAFSRMTENAPFYIFTTFILAYGTQTLKVDRNFLLTALLCAALLSGVWIPLFAAVSDRIGRKRMYMIGAACTGIFGFIYFTLLDTGNSKLIFLAITLSLMPHGMTYGTQAAMIAESFTGRLRYSGASLGYQLASIIAGGPAPLIATALFAYYATANAIAVYIAVCALISIVAVWFMPDRSKADINVEYDHT